MSVTLSTEQREALDSQPALPLHFEDPLTQVSYILMTGAQFQRLVYDDSDLTPGEMAAASGIAADAAESA